MLFIPSWDGVVYALDEYNGQLRWSFNTGTGIYSSPAVANGIVYVGSRNGLMYAINEQSGAMVWNKGSLNFPITSSPVVADGKVIYGTWCTGLCSPAGQFMARDANTGAILWTNQTTASAAVVSSPAVHNGLVFFGQNDGSILAMTEATGALVWQTFPSTAVAIGSAPAVAYGRVYVGTGNRFVVLDELNGSVDWVFNDGSSNATSAAVSNGVVYYGTGRGNIFARNATTGAQLWSWSSPTGSAISSAPALALGSNVLLVGSNDDYLYALDMASGSLVWRFQTGGAVSSSPAVADGRVFVGSQDSRVYAVGARLPTLQVQVFPGNTSLKPGEISTLTITVTSASNPVPGSALSLTSSAGGGFTPPVEQSPGLYKSNYTSPLVSSTVVTTIIAVASKPGYFDGSGQAQITLNPFPPLSVLVTATPTATAPGGEVILVITVLNGNQPTTGASIFLSSTEGGSFTSVTDTGNGNYTATFATGLQPSSPTVTVQASKAGFSPGQAQVIVTVSGIPDPVTTKIAGLPLILILGVLFLLAFALFVGMIARGSHGQDDESRYSQDPPSYSLRPRFREGLSNGFRASRWGWRP